MDATKKPLRIPPEFARYAEEKQIFQLLEQMLQELLVARPSDPLEFMANFLKKPGINIPKVIVYGPPASGKRTISKLAASKLHSVHVSMTQIIDYDTTASGEEARTCIKQGKPLPAQLATDLVVNRLKQEDCQTKGWVMEGFPNTREQALVLQSAGVLAKHFVHLEAPDSVLVERYSGKRVDPVTGDVYHLTFAPPNNTEVANRLKEEDGGIEVNMHAKLQHYHEHYRDLLQCYKETTCAVNADQPITDVFSQVFTFLHTRLRSAAPITPHVVLLGPTGAGKSVQAAILAEKYQIMDVDFNQLVQQTLASDSKLASVMRPFNDSNVAIPDDMLLEVLTNRLNQLDCATRGWVLHGFPLNRDQAEGLFKAGHHPNRVYFLNIPPDSVLERLTLQGLDPLTGERYHSLYKPPPNQEVKSRLITHPSNREEAVKERLTQYHANVDDLTNYYTSGQHINADLDPRTVSECIETILVNPLPKPQPFELK
ncbi:adenylate kinase 8-like [Dysidea avara]|uniref:adenylate kinase 8-like n=1 Tax=Dysidea avara TaxID=196820 RepID=UPI003329DCCF